MKYTKEQVEQINNYARHQFNRGGLNIDLIPLEDWIDDKTKLPNK